MSLLSKSGQRIINSFSQRILSINNSSNNNIRSSYDFKHANESQSTLFREQDNRTYINEANQIMLNRFKRKGSTINSRCLVASVILKDSKQIGLHNYMIDNLRIKRTDINDKVRMISKALRDSGTRLDCDFKEFVEFVEQTKREQKQKEEELAALKLNNDNLSKELKVIREDYKRNTDDLEKTLKMLSLVRSYGAFVHRVLNIPFSYSQIPDIVIDNNKEKQYEDITNVILKNYDKMITSNQPSALEDDALLLQHFVLFEDKVIKLLENKQIIDKELNKISQAYTKDLSELENREKNTVKESKYIREERNQIIHSIKELRKHKNSEVEETMGYILELGIDICGNREKGKKRNFLECLGFTRNILDVLSDKEKIVNAYIKEIEQSEITDEQEIRMIVGERKKTNKREKQMMVKMKQDEENSMKRIRAEERARRVVIKGRIVPKEYPLMKIKMKQTLDDMENDNDEYKLLNYSEEDY